MKKRVVLGILSLVSALAIVGCSSGNENTSLNHSTMNHSASEIPKGLPVAKDPMFKIGSTVVIKEGHMEGMKGAEATVVGVFDTTAYAISYTPTTGGEKVTNHKWIIQEEIKDSDKKTVQVGDEVVVNAEHTKGMDGVTATIDSLEKTNVYAIDYKPTNADEKVTNHMWVVENELQTVKELVDEYSANKDTKVSASVTSTQLVLTDSEEKKTTYDLPKDEFFVSIAPYIETTHPCATHSLTGCQGELKKEEFKVLIKDSEGKTVIDQTLTSKANGFIDLWLPREKNFTVTIEYKGKKATSEIGTFEKSDTCVSTMQLK